MVEQDTYKQILDSLTTAVMVLDRNLHIAHMNASAEALLGLSFEHVESRPLQVCFDNEHDTSRELIDELHKGRHFTKRKVPWKLHNESLITVDYTVTPSPEVGYISLEVQPLDRLLRINREEAWLSSQETSRNLVRSMAHEIKNPLGGIRGAAQLLSRELGDGPQEEYTRIIIEETDRLRDLVDRMLGPRHPPELREINIHEVLAHVAAVVEMEVQNKVAVLLDYDPSIPDVYGDKAQLIQAFLNIARNAVQALTENSLPDAPILRIETRIKRRFTIGRVNHPLVACVKVCDNGPGIPKELIDDIFFPMITGRSEGTGLGLSIAQNLVGQHHGLIECSSAPGATEFAVYLPLGNLHV